MEETILDAFRERKGNINDELVAVVSLLRDLWMKGIYIGDPVVIFGSFRRVGTADRQRVKKELKALYDEMKATHPPVVNIDWSG